MSIKIYTDDIPNNILEQLKSLNIIGNKDILKVVYVNTFLGKIRETNLLTPERLIHWQVQGVKDGKKIISLKKIKDISYDEKGLFGTITYHLSSKKTFSLKLNRQDGEKFMELSRKIWDECKKEDESKKDN